MTQGPDSSQFDEESDEHDSGMGCSRKTHAAALRDNRDLDLSTYELRRKSMVQNPWCFRIKKAHIQSGVLTGQSSA